MSFAPISTSALVQAVGATSAQFGAIALKECWYLSVTAATWVCQGVNPTATAGAGSFLVQPGEPALLDGSLGTKVAVLQASVAGTASLVKLRNSRPL